MDKFAEDAMYIIVEHSEAHGKAAIKEHLRSMFAGSPPLTFTMYDLKCEGNMAVAILGNNLNDGNSFLLTSIDFFNDRGEVILNIDCYNFYGAAGQVLGDLCKRPKDAAKVVEQQVEHGCTIV